MDFTQPQLSLIELGCYEGANDIASIILGPAPLGSSLTHRNLRDEFRKPISVNFAVSIAPCGLAIVQSP